MIIFESTLITFEACLIFWGSWGSIKNWLELKIEPPLTDLALLNPWNTLYHTNCFLLQFCELKCSVWRGPNRERDVKANNTSTNNNTILIKEAKCLFWPLKYSEFHRVTSLLSSRLFWVNFDHFKRLLHFLKQLW